MATDTYRRSYAQAPVDSVSATADYRSYPKDAFVIDVAFGDSQQLAFLSGQTLEDGTTVVADGGLIWNKWNNVPGLARLDSTDNGTAFVPITTNLGSSASDCGPEVAIGSLRSKKFLPGQWGMVKCAVPGASLGLPAANPATNLSGIVYGGLLQGLIEGHIKPAVRWCYNNNFVPYLGNVYVSLGGADCLTSAPVEHAMSFAANFTAMRRRFASELGLRLPPQFVLAKLPLNIPTASYAHREELRLQYPYLGTLVALYEYSKAPRQADAVHLTAQGALEFGEGQVRTAHIPHWRTQKIDPV